MYLITISPADLENRPPAVNAIAGQSVTAGDTFAYIVTAMDAEGKDLVYSLTVKPDNAAINSSGAITWDTSAADPDEYEFGVLVFDGTLATVTSFTVTVMRPDGNGSPNTGMAPRTGAQANLLADLLEGDDPVLYVDSAYSNSTYANALASRFGMVMAVSDTGDWQADTAAETVVVLVNSSFSMLDLTGLALLHGNTTEWYVVDSSTTAHDSTVVDVYVPIGSELTRIYSRPANVRLAPSVHGWHFALGQFSIPPTRLGFCSTRLFHARVVKQDQMPTTENASAAARLDVATTDA